MTKLNHGRWSLRLSDNHRREIAKFVELSTSRPNQEWPVSLRPIGQSQKAQGAIILLLNKLDTVLDDMDQLQLREDLSVAIDKLLSAKAYHPYDNQFTVGQWLSETDSLAHPVIEVLTALIKFSRTLSTKT